jgi:hypothetical protein
MAKKAKLELNALRVKSFVTSLKDEEKKDVKGGKSCTYCSQLDSCDTYCITEEMVCD